MNTLHQLSAMGVFPWIRSPYDVVIPLLPEAFSNYFLLLIFYSSESTKIVVSIRITKETTKMILAAVVSSYVIKGTVFFLLNSFVSYILLSS
jgi:hypothetical protein